MIQILKYGKYNSGECTECECQFAFTRDELSNDDTIKCPCCGEEITVLSPTGD